MVKRIQAIGVPLPENYCYSEDKNKKSIDRQFEQALVNAIASVKDEKNVDRSTQALKTLLDYLTLEVIPFQDPPGLQLVILNTLQDMLTCHEKKWNDGLAFTLWDFCETHSDFFEEKIIGQFIQCAIAHQNPDLLQRMGFYLYHQNAESKSLNNDKQTQVLLCLVSSGQDNLKVHCYEHLMNVPTDLKLSSLAVLVKKLEVHKQVQLYFNFLQTPVIASLELQARTNLHAANELSEIFYHAWLLSENESQENITYYFIQTLSYARHAIRTNDESIVRSVVDRVVKVYEWLHPEELEDPLADTILKVSQEYLMILNNMMPAVRALHSFYFGSKDKKEEYEIAYSRARELEHKEIGDRNVDDETKAVEAALEELKGFSQNVNEKAAVMSTKLSECQRELRKDRAKTSLFNCISDSKNPNKVENGFWGIYSLWDQLELQPYEISIFSDLLREKFKEDTDDIFPFTPTLAILFANIPNIKNELPEDIFSFVMQHGLNHFDELTSDVKNRVKKWDGARLELAKIQTAIRNKENRRNVITKTLYALGLLGFIDIVRGYPINTTVGWFANTLSQPCVTAVNKFNHPVFYQNLDSCRTGEMQACAKAAEYTYGRHRLDFINEVRQSFDLDYFGDKAATAVRDNDLEALKTLRTINPEILKHRKDLLLIAAKNPDAAYMTEFLYHNHYPIDQTTHHETPLVTALRANNTAVAKVLIEKGASLLSGNYLSLIAGDYRSTPLYIAIKNNNVEAVRIIALYQKEEAKSIIYRNQHLIEETVKNGNLEMFKVLFELDYHSGIYSTHWKYIVKAIQYQHRDIVLFLVNQFKNIDEFFMNLTLTEKFSLFKEEGIIKLVNMISESGFEFKEKEIVQRILIREASKNHMLKLVTLLLSMVKENEFHFDAYVAVYHSYAAIALPLVGPCPLIDSTVLELVIKMAASKKDFEKIIKSLPLPNPKAIPARYFALIINAGGNTQLDLDLINNEFSQEFIMNVLDDLNKIEKLSATYCKVEPRKLGLQKILMYAVKNSYPFAVQQILKFNLIDYDTAKQVALQAHKIHSGIYNLLRNYMRSIQSSVVPQHYAFYQPPKAHSQPKFSKESGRRRQAHR